MKQKQQKSIKIIIKLKSKYTKNYKSYKNGNNNISNNNNKQPN